MIDPQHRTRPLALALVTSLLASQFQCARPPRTALATLTAARGAPTTPPAGRPAALRPAPQPAALVPLDVNVLRVVRGDASVPTVPELLAAHPFLAGQQLGDLTPTAPTGPSAAPAALLAGDARARVHAVAESYRAWGRVDDELRWAPWLCRMPLPSRPAFSAADDGTPHAQKLYFLYARDRAAYVTGGEPSPGQVLVKESWAPHPIAPDQAVRVDGAPIVAQRDGQTWEPGAYAGLFVMLRVPAGTAESDAGWIYGTVNATGEVTAAGRVASCIGCHEQAGPTRLFGWHAARH